MVTPCDGGPRAKPFGQGAPGATGAHDPQDPFQHELVITRWTPQPRPRQQRGDLYPTGRRQLRQTRHAQRRRPWRAGWWSLPGATEDMAALCARLVLSTKARPPQPLLPAFLRVPQGGQQAAQFGDTQPDPLGDTAPFSPSCWA